MSYSLVQFGTIYFTDTGLVDGKPCRVLIAGLSKVRFSKRGQNVFSADNTPYLFLTPNFNQGIPLTFSIRTITKTVLDSLYTLMNALNENDDVVRVIITGPEGNFDLKCQLNFNAVPISYKPDIKGSSYVNDVRINVITNGDY